MTVVLLTLPFSSAIFLLFTHFIVLFLLTAFRKKHPLFFTCIILEISTDLNETQYS